MKLSNSLLAASLLSVTSLSAYASLTVTANGLGVYDSGIDATWTRDGNLLGTMEANAIAKYGNDSSLIADIINVNDGVDHETNYIKLPLLNTYSVSTNDFGSNGRVDYFGELAFVHYLNVLNYGGSNQWAVPTTTYPSSPGYGRTDDQLGQLYYNELNAIAGPGLLGSSNWGIFHNGYASYASPGIAGPFFNVQASDYWSTSAYSINLNSAWFFDTYDGGQGYIYKSNFQIYAWAVTPGNIATVPLPSAVWLFTSALLGLGLARRKTPSA